MPFRWNFRQPRWIFGLAVIAALATNAKAQPTTEDTEAVRKQIVEKGLRYLSANGQDDKGLFSSRVGPGVTALTLTAAMRNGMSPQDPMVAKGLAALESFVKPDGGVYGNGRLRNYETCVAITCFAEANQTGKYNEILGRAKDFVTGMQYGRVGGDPANPWNGGASYGGEGRPDLSNTFYLLEALEALETPADDPAIQAALKFVSRCQNLKSEHNDTPFADKVNDGGFIYYIPSEKIDESTSDPRFTANGGLRSYGSMTYAGLKSMIYAGLTKDDPRVKSATTWIGEHYAVDENPGMGSAGLFYYFHTFGAALKASTVDRLMGSDGTEHDWRNDLINELAGRQNDDGSWSNENERWFENDKNLATAFALMALSYCDPPKP